MDSTNQTTSRAYAYGIGCSIFVLFVCLCCGSLYLLDPLGLVLGWLGFDNGGRTETYLSELQPQPTIDWSGLQPNFNPDVIGSGGGEASLPPPQIAIQLEGQQAVISTEDLQAEQILQTQGTDGQPIYYVEYNEQGANTLVANNWALVSDPDVKNNIRNPQVDFRPGAIVVSAEGNVPVVGWQPVSVVLVFNETGQQFEIAGISIAGILYQEAPVVEIQEMVQEIEDQGNQALREARIVSGASSAAVQQVHITDTSLEIVVK